MTQRCSTEERSKGTRLMLKLSTIALAAALIATSAHAGPTLAVGQEITVSEATAVSAGDKIPQ